MEYIFLVHHKYAIEVNMLEDVDSTTNYLASQITKKPAQYTTATQTIKIAKNTQTVQNSIIRQKS